MWNVLLPIICLCTALLFSAVSVPLIIRLSHRFGWYDFHDPRKTHTGLIPRLGGVGMAFSFLLSIAVVVFLVVPHTPIPLPIQDGYRYLSVVTGFLIMHVTGLVDDFHNLRALKKFLFQVCAATAVAAGGSTISEFTIPYLGSIPLGVFAYPATVIWIVGISNAFNFIDGMDGLAGGIGAIAALSMAVVALLCGQLPTAMISLALMGAIGGFLIYNFPPARIFMGDSGSLSLGFTLSVIPLLGISRAASFTTLIIPVTLLTVPIVDTFWAIVRRVRQGKPFYAPDRQHIHHKLLELGMSERRILAVLCSFCLYLGVVAVTSIMFPVEMDAYLMLIVWIGSALSYGFLSHSGTRRSAENRPKESQDRASVG